MEVDSLDFFVPIAAVMIHQVTKWNLDIGEHKNRLLMDHTFNDWSGTSHIYDDGTLTTGLINYSVVSAYGQTQYSIVHISIDLVLSQMNWVKSCDGYCSCDDSTIYVAVNVVAVLLLL